MSRNDWLLVGIITAAAFVLRLYGIDDASLWTDEGYSIWFGRQPLTALWGEIARNEYNPILYYMILHVWMDVFGDSATSVRALSAVLNCLTIPFIYLATRWALRTPQASLVATLACVLFALAFSELQYAQEARTYTLCVLAIAIAVTATVRISAELLDPVASEPAPLPYWPFVALAFGCALAVWAHYTSLIFLAVLGAYHLGLVWITRQRQANLFQLYGLAAALFLVLAGRALWLMFAYALPASDNFWIGVPTFTDVIDATSIIFGGALAVDSWGLEVLSRALLFGPWPVLGAYVLWKRGHTIERASLILLLSTSLIAFIAYLAVTYMGKPVFLQRIVLPAQIGWVILCAASLLAFKAVHFRQAAAGLLVAAFCFSSLSYLTGNSDASNKEPWKAIAQDISNSADEGETVFVTATGEVLMDHYLDLMGRNDLELVSINGSYRTPDARPAFDASAIRYTTPIDAQIARQFEVSLIERPSAWVVLRNPNSPNWAELHPILESAKADQIDYQPGPLALYRVHPNAGSGTPFARDSE
ncbi:MAG: hypothetical protein AAFX86_08230 [Pseudomonadota bacterium]